MQTTPIDLFEPLPVERRADLVLAPRMTRHGRWWTVKDPLSLEYSQLRDEELFVFQRLDGKTSAGTILRDFGRQFAPLQLGVAELMAFVHGLSERGLVTLKGRYVRHRVASSRRRRHWQLLSNPLAIRFRGFDPQPLLDRCYPGVRWLFSRAALCMYLLVVVSALLLIATHWDGFQMRAPAMSTMLSADNLIAFAVAFACVKVLHELGHAFVCRHFGGECRELGILLLAFIPCLYCNVSDAWLLRNRWHRIAVSAAGIGVELVAASICTFLWWYSQPGLLNSVCFSVMFVASLGTVLINGNPLLRYDGYHILADLLDIPNLRQRATASWRRMFARWVFGVAETDDRYLIDGWRVPLALFGVTSSLYLWFVLIVILRFLDRGLEPLGLRPVAVALAFLVIGGRLMSVSVSASRRVNAWSASGLLRPVRFSVGVVLVGGVLAGVLLTPLPHRVAAPGVVAIRDARSVYVTVAGQLSDERHRVRYGDVLSAGETLTTLQNFEVERDIVRLQGECEQRRAVLTALRLIPQTDAAAAARRRSAEAELQDYEGRLAQREEDRSALTLTAPIDGVLLRPVEAVARDTNPLKRTGAPLDDVNCRAYLETGTMIGLMGTPGRFDALLAVEQGDIPFVRRGQTVSVRLPQLGDVVATGTVTEIAARELEVSPQPLVRTKRLSSRIDEDGTIRPVRPVYEVRVALTDVPETLVVGATGDARIEAGRMTLARRLIRVLGATFVSNN